jgi:predicted DNA-binding ribbon-helix-helix protein
MTPKRAAGIMWHRIAVDRTMKSSVLKRSIVIAGHKTSVSLEDTFWRELREIASARNITLSQLVGMIDAERQHGNLSSAIRLFVLSTVRDRIAEQEKRGKPRLSGAEIPLAPKQDH